MLRSASVVVREIGFVCVSRVPGNSKSEFPIMFRVASVTPSPIALRSRQSVSPQSPVALRSESRVIPFPNAFVSSASVSSASASPVTVASPVASTLDDQWQTLGQAASNVLRHLRPMSAGTSSEV